MANSYFYPRPPRGGRLRVGVHQLGAGGISIHALREEGDGDRAGQGFHAALISIHALREEGDTLKAVAQAKYEISIHALREEGDAGEALRVGGVVISIHALREEGDILNQSKQS